MKTVCIYHTRSGNSEKIARQIARELDAEVLAVTDGKDRKGFFGYIGAAVEGLRKSLPAILPCAPEYPPEEYDRVIVVAPIWCENVSPVMRAFLAQNKGRFRGELYYVITRMSGISYLPRIDALRELTGKDYTDLLQVKTHKHDPSGEVAAFIARLNT